MEHRAGTMTPAVRLDLVVVASRVGALASARMMMERLTVESSIKWPVKRVLFGVKRWPGAARSWATPGATQPRRNSMSGGEKCSEKPPVRRMGLGSVGRRCPGARREGADGKILRLGGEGVRGRGDRIELPTAPDEAGLPRFPLDHPDRALAANGATYT